MLFAKWADVINGLIPRHWSDEWQIVAFISLLAVGLGGYLWWQNRAERRGFTQRTEAAPNDTAAQPTEKKPAP